jgi:hypothetical protein
MRLHVRIHMLMKMRISIWKKKSVKMGGSYFWYQVTDDIKNNYQLNDIGQLPLQLHDKIKENVKGKDGTWLLKILVCLFLCLFSINNEILEITDEYKYLGVVFSQSGKCKKAHDHFISLSRKVMHLLFKRIFNLNFPIDLQLKLFDNTILST